MKLQFYTCTKWKQENNTVGMATVNILFKAHRVTKVIILQMFPFKPYHEVYTAAVRMCPKFEIASINESEDREV